MNRDHKSQRDSTQVEKDMLKELEQRGTAEINNGIVTQVTQAISEGESEVTFLVYSMLSKIITHRKLGELVKQKIIPIDEACARCNDHYFPTTKECQGFQARDARARGFSKLICPQQFV